MNTEGDARRFCDVCTKQVHDLSAMTEHHAREVLVEESAKGRVCVRYTADRGGNIRFLPDPARLGPAPSLWRASLAAAGMSLMLMTGCADGQPDQVNEDSCVYEVGPWSFTASRGQGSCPELELEFEHEQLVGKVAIEPPPEPPPPVMGVPPQIEEPIAEVLGEIEPIDEIEPIHEIKGKIAAPIELEEVEFKGDVAFDPTAEEPCDPEPEGSR